MIGEKIIHLASFPEKNPMPISEIDLDGNILYLNPAIKEIFPDIEALGIKHDWFRGMIPVDAQKVIFSKEKITGREIKIGQMYFGQALHYNAERRTVRIYGADITNRRQFQEALEKEKKEREAILDSVPAMIFYKDRENRFIRTNKAFEETMGLPKEKLEGRPLSEIYPKEQADIFFSGDKAVMESGKPKTGIIECMETVNGTKWVRTDKIPYKDEQGKIIGVIGFTVDITGHKKREEELGMLNRTLKALSDNNHEIMCAENEFEYLKKICEIVVKTCGHTMVWIGFAQDDEAKTVRPVAYSGFEEGYLDALDISWADVERGRGPTGIAIRTGKPCTCKNMRLDPKFKPWRNEAVKRDYASSISLPLIADGKSLGALSIYSHKEDSFLPAEVELLSKLADDIAYGIISIRLRIAHKEAVDALKKAHIQLEEKVTERTAELALTNEKLMQEIAGRAKIESEIRARNTLLRLAAKVKSKKEYLDILVKLIKVWADSRCVGIRLINENRKIPYESYLGFSREFWEKENWISLKEDQCACIRVVKGEFLPQDKSVITKNGSFFTGNSIKFLNGLTQRQRMDFRGQCIKTGFVSIAIIPIKYKNNMLGAIHLADERENKPGSEKVAFIESLGPHIAEDVSKFILADKMRESEEALLKAQKELMDAKRLSDIGMLAATVAHELRNPLAAINMAAYNINRKAANPLLGKHLATIEKKVSESEQIITNLLFYSRLKPPHHDTVNIFDILDECIDAAASRHKQHSIKIIRKLKPLKNIFITVDSLQIKEVFANLLNNAYDSMPQKRKGKIEITAEAGNEFISILIKDAGLGIADEDLKRVFDPFFTTKAKGTGLGLSVCKQIINFHNGAIDISSQKDKGTAVTVKLPVKQKTHEKENINS